MKKFIVLAGAILAYWALLFLGPAIVMLFNNIGYYVSGGGWGPGSLMHKILQFFSQPVACIMAYTAVKAICKDSHKIAILINCVIATCVCVLLVFTAKDSINMWAMIISAVSCAATVYMEAKAINTPTNA